MSLVNEFPKIVIYETQHIQHASFENENIEQINVMAELVGRIQETNTNSMSNLVMTVREKNNLWNATTWIDYLKYGAAIIFLGIVVLLIILWLCVCVPWRGLCETCLSRVKRPKRSRAEAAPMIELHEVTAHYHTDTYYVPGRGLFWKDHCSVHTPSTTN